MPRDDEELSKKIQQASQDPPERGTGQGAIRHGQELGDLDTEHDRTELAEKMGAELDPPPDGGPGEGELSPDDRKPSGPDGRGKPTGP